MRIRQGNPFHDQHELFEPWRSGGGFTMRTYEFVTHAGTNPHSVSQAAEYVLGDTVVFGHGAKMVERRWQDDINTTIGSPFFGTHWHLYETQKTEGSPDRQGVLDGAVWTSWREEHTETEPALWVCIALYDQHCADGCPAGHPGYNVRRARTVAPWELDAIKEEIGEHPTHRLGVTPEQDVRVLSTLGFTPLDGPLAGDPNVDDAAIYRALDYLARLDRLKYADHGTFEYKLKELRRLGYPLDYERIKTMVATRKLDINLVGV